MAKLSDLVEVTAEVTGWSRNNVGLYARYAREAGYITQGARGTAAPDMTARDAAVLLVAMMGSRYAKDAGETIAQHQRNKSNISYVNSYLFKGMGKEETERVSYQQTQRWPFSQKADEKGVMNIIYDPHIETSSHNIVVHKGFSYLFKRHDTISSFESIIHTFTTGAMDRLCEHVNKDFNGANAVEVTYSVMEGRASGRLTIKTVDKKFKTGGFLENSLIVDYGVIASDEKLAMLDGQNGPGLRTVRYIDGDALRAIASAL